MSKFDELYSASDESLKERKKPYVEKALKRKFNAALDSAENQKIDAEERTEELRQDLKDLDIDKLLEQSNIIDAADTTIKLIKKEYKTLFGTDL